MKPLHRAAVLAALPLLLLLLPLRRATPTPAQPAEAPTRWAVIIGIGQYEDPGIAPLEYADEDAWALASFLTSPEAGQGTVAPENLTLLLNEEATARSIRRALITFLRRAKPEDVITVFLAGHSASDPDRMSEVYFLPYDTELESLPETALPVDHIFHALGQAYAYQKILLADVSRSGWVQHEDRRGLLPNPVNRLLLNGGNLMTGRFVALTASEPGQGSVEGRRYGGGHGAFTHYLVEGLKGAADGDRDRVVRLGELIDFTRSRVRMATDGRQLPTVSLSEYDPAWVLSGGD